MLFFKRLFKRNSHNLMIKPLAGFGRAINRYYENRNHDSYSNGELTVIKKLAHLKPSIIIDGGANVGNYSIMVANSIPNCKIYAFEPVKSTFDKLKENTRKYPSIFPINKGLYNNTCKKKINLFPGDEHSSIYDIAGLRYNISETEIIELISGDKFIDDDNFTSIDFLKLDIEGAEYEALLGFENALKLGLIKCIQFEYGYINITTKRLLIDYYTLLQQYDFAIGKIFPKVVEFRNYDFLYEDFLGPNFIAVRNTEQELIKSLTNKK